MCVSVMRVSTCQHRLKYCSVCKTPNTSDLKNSFGNKIPFSQPTFKRLVIEFNLPKPFLELIAKSVSGVFAKFQSDDNEIPGTGNPH